MECALRQSVRSVGYGKTDDADALNLFHISGCQLFGNKRRDKDTQALQNGVC